MAPADDEPEVARAGTRDDARVRVARQRLDDDQRVGRAVRERATERRAERGEVDRRADRPRRERRPVVDGDLGGAPEQSALVGHGMASPSFPTVGRGDRRGR